jgi:hypothetical protein
VIHAPDATDLWVGQPSYESSRRHQRQWDAHAADPRGPVTRNREPAGVGMT